MEINDSTSGLVPQQEQYKEAVAELGVDYYRHVLSSKVSIILSFMFAVFAALFSTSSFISLVNESSYFATSDYVTFIWLVYLIVIFISLGQTVLSVLNAVVSLRLYQRVSKEETQENLIKLVKKSKILSLINFGSTLLMFGIGLTTFVAKFIIGEPLLIDHTPNLVWLFLVAIAVFITLSLYLIAVNKVNTNKNGKLYYLTMPVQPVSKLEFTFSSLGIGLKNIGITLFNFIMIFVKSFIGIFVGIYKIVIQIFKKTVTFFKTFIDTFKNNGFKTRLSYFFMGVGHSFMERPLKTILYLTIQVLYTLFMVMPNGGLYYLSKFDNLGDRAGYYEYVCQIPGQSVETCPRDFLAQSEFHTEDNSMLIVLFSVATILLTVAVAVIYWLSIKGVAKADKKYETAKNEYRNELARYQEEKEVFESESTLIPQNEITQSEPKFKNPLPTFRQELKELLNSRFHITTLSVPTLTITVFTILPLVFMILLAFTNFNKENGPPNTLFTWVGLQTFSQLFTSVGGSSFSTAFLDILQWTFIWAFFATFSNYIFGLILAMIINRKGIRLKKLWRTVFVITIAVPQFVTLLLMSQLLYRYGPINETLLKLGWISDYIGFLTDPKLAKVTVILVNIWVGVPYTMLITSGILMNIPGDLYESARIDGASPFTQFTKITLPYMLFVTGPYLITQFIGNINNFNVIFFLTGGGPSAALPGVVYGKTDILVTWLYSLTVGGSQQQYAIGSALGIFIFAISVFITLSLYSRTSAATQEGDFA